MTHQSAKTLLTGLILILSSTSWAGEADVVGGAITALGDGRFRVDATVRHDDTGWDHYANRWDVLAPDGTILGSRVPVSYTHLTLPTNREV